MNYLTKLADVLVRYSTAVKNGDLVAVIAEPAAMPLVKEIYAACLRAGANPFYSPRSEDLQELLVAHGSDEQIAFVSPIQQHLVETIDVSIALWAEQNSQFLAGYPASKAALLQQARKPYLKRFMQREAEKTLRWVGSQYPTQASAQDAGMSLRLYEEFVYRAGLLHLPDPVAAWQAVERTQQRVVDYLQGRKELHFRVPPHNGHDGTDLKVDVSKATWINCCGHSNFPDGEVFAGPGGVDGHVNYTFPAVYMGHRVEGVRLKFKAGRVVEATARSGEAFLHQMLDQDAGARTLGEIAIGTNYGIRNFSCNTLFDEKIGGTFHAAVGAGYPKSGNTNESGLHWDMVCDLRPLEGRPGGTIHSDGALLHADGLFVDPAFPRPAAG